MNIEKTDAVIYAETNPKEYFDKICKATKEIHPMITVMEMAPHDPKDFMNLHMIEKKYAFDDVDIDMKTNCICGCIEESIRNKQFANTYRDLYCKEKQKNISSNIVTALHSILFTSILWLILMIIL